MLMSSPDDFETVARNLRTEFLQGIEVIEISAEVKSDISDLLERFAEIHICLLSL